MKKGLFFVGAICIAISSAAIFTAFAEPFPHYTAVKESFLNDVNTPRLEKVILFLDNRLRRLLARAEKRD